MSTTIEMEELQNERARLEEESRYLDEELKQLEICWKVLDEKVAIQELKNANAAKQGAISQLQSKINLLETQLEKLPTASMFEKENTATDDNAEPQEAIQESGDASEEEQAKDEDTITVTPLDEEEISENFGTGQEKKKFQLLY